MDHNHLGEANFDDQLRPFTKPPAWQEEFQWAMQFMPEIRNILPQYLLSISIADPVADMTENSDLIVQTVRFTGNTEARIAVRIRRHKYLLRFPNQFTIRTDVPSGAKTEFDKLKDGFGDIMFYGFAASDETTLEAWTLIDLAEFRKWRAKAFARLHTECATHVSNPDGTSFYAYRTDLLNACSPDFKIIIARKDAGLVPERM